jgi:hypothetical protein
MDDTGTTTQWGTVSVASWSNPPKAKQKGSTTTIDTLDARLMNATMINGQLMTAHTVNSGGAAHARWYQIDTTGATPSLYQWGEINPGTGVDTYFPTVAMNTQGDIGMTYMESSANEYLSMYVTGQSYLDAGTGKMQTPVVTQSGTDVYTSTRTGDYSGISVDPDDGLTFWAANEYKGSEFWNTGIASFTISPSSPAPVPAPVPAAGAPVIDRGVFASVLGLEGRVWYEPVATGSATASVPVSQPLAPDWLFGSLQARNAEAVSLGLSQEPARFRSEPGLDVVLDGPWLGI